MKKQKATFETVELELRDHGLNLFADLLHFDNFAKNSLSTGKVKIMVALTDDAVRELVPFGKTMSDVMSTESGRDIIRSHLMVNYDFITKVATALNGRQIDTNTIVKAEIPSFDIGDKDIRVVVAAKAIIDTKQIEDVTTDRSVGLGGLLGYDNFLRLIESGNLKGKDLISLCLSSSDTNEFCNARDSEGKTIFDRLIYREYGYKNIGERNARDFYIKLWSAYKFAVTAPDRPGSHKRLEIRNGDVVTTKGVGLLTYAFNRQGNAVRTTVQVKYNDNSAVDSREFTFIVDITGEFLYIFASLPGDKYLRYPISDSPCRRIVAITKSVVGLIMLCDTGVIYRLTFLHSIARAPGKGIVRAVSELIFNDPELHVVDIYADMVKARRRSDNALVLIWRVKNHRDVWPGYYDANIRMRYFRNAPSALIYNTRNNAAFIYMISDALGDVGSHKINIGPLHFLGMDADVTNMKIEFGKTIFSDEADYVANPEADIHLYPSTWQVAILDYSNPNGTLYARTEFDDWEILDSGVEDFFVTRSFGFIIGSKPFEQTMVNKISVLKKGVISRLSNGEVLYKSDHLAFDPLYYNIDPVLNHNLLAYYR